MASTVTKTASKKSILKPSITLKSHRDEVGSICYFPDGQRMISGSRDRTARQWDLKTGKEIEEARGVCEGGVYAVAVSRNGRWVATGGGGGELQACEVETGIVKTFKGHSAPGLIECIDISADNALLASGSVDETVRIWNLDTGKLVAGPFKSGDLVGAVRFSPDSKKLAVMSWLGRCLEVWDVQSQKLDVKLEEHGGEVITWQWPVFWTNTKNIIAAYRFTKEDDNIYEFDASTLEIVRTPFEGHTNRVISLALSFDQALLASASSDHTIKLWAFETRQLLASFNVLDISRLVFSPDSRQLAYTTRGEDNNKIFICVTPPKVLAQARNIARTKSNLDHLLHSDATRPPAGYRRPPISTIPVQRPLSTRDPQQPAFTRLSKLLHFSRANAVLVRHIHPRDPLDVPATLPLPSSLSAQPATRFDHFEIGSPPPPSSGVVRSLRQHLSFLVPRHSNGPPVVEVAPGRKFTRLAAANFPDYKKVDDTRHLSSQQGAVPQENDTADADSLPDVHWCKAFLCYCSCLSHGRLRMPPRWRLERVDIPRQDGASNSNSGGAHSRS